MAKWIVNVTTAEFILSTFHGLRRTVDDRENIFFGTNNLSKLIDLIIAAEPTAKKETYDNDQTISYTFLDSTFIIIYLPTNTEKDVMCTASWDWSA